MAPVKQEHSQVIVVGVGPVGSLVATRLAQAGLKVTALELVCLLSGNTASLMMLQSEAIPKQAVSWDFRIDRS